MSRNSAYSRRDFLKGSAAVAGGLVVGFYLPVPGARAAMLEGASRQAAFEPNAFIRVARDNSVTVMVKHLEMGQGVYTGLPTLVAEELDVDWKKIRVAAAPADVERYGNLAWGGSMQGTGGSTSLTNSWEQLRRAGAQARAMLIAAAAESWKVDPATLTTRDGHVLHVASTRKATYGELAEKAATVAPPADVRLKAAKDWKLIGTAVPRTDARAKCDGTARFGWDQRQEGTLTALVRRAPRFGAKVKSFEAAKARGMPGVKAVVQIPQGVAVVATDFWSAKQARDALSVEWDESGAEKRSSAQFFADYRKRLEQPGAVARNDGDAEKTLAGAAKTVAATFEFPFLAHAPMETLSCVVSVTDDGCDVWAGSQLQTLDHKIAAEITGLPKEKVRIHTLMAGGSFGRHANPTSDYINEAVSVATAARSLAAPIKLVWTREDDVQGGYYRPLCVHSIRAGLDAGGKPVAWRQHIVSQSIMTGTPFAGMIKDGIDPTSVEGASTLPYAIPNLRVELTTTQSPVTVLWWRSVGHTHTAFSTEVMTDMLAEAAGEDPVAFRLKLLGGDPRHAGVLKLAAEKAGWGKPLPKGRGRGVAVHKSFDSYVAEVAEVSVKDDGTFRVERVVCAVDCGVAVNTNIVRMQMESGIVFGLTAARYGEITLDQGRVQQSNFNDYPVLRMDETPKIEVHIVPSTEKPTGVGEPGVPPIAPAVANAIFAATGKRLTRLPMKPEDLKGA